MKPQSPLARLRLFAVLTLAAGLASCSQLREAEEQRTSQEEPASVHMVDVDALDPLS